MMVSPRTNMNNNKRIFAFLSLGLLLAALLIPIPIMAAFGPQVLPLSFGVVAGWLALLFGALSWSDHIGRSVAMLSVLVVVVGVVGVVYMNRRAEEPAVATTAPQPAGQK
jgi:hypothetical protein